MLSPSMSSMTMAAAPSACSAPRIVAISNDSRHPPPTRHGDEIERDRQAQKEWSEAEESDVG